MTIKEGDDSRKKAIEKATILNKLKKDDNPRLEKKNENCANDEYYSKVLNNSNFVLPSLFNEKVASIALPM